MWYYSTKLLIRFPVLLTMWFPFHWRLMSGLDYRWIIALWYLGKLRWCIFQIHRDLSMFRDGSGGKKRKKKKDRFVSYLYFKCILDYHSFKALKTLKLTVKIKQEEVKTGIRHLLLSQYIPKSMCDTSASWSLHFSSFILHICNWAPSSVFLSVCSHFACLTAVSNAGTQQQPFYLLSLHEWGQSSILVLPHQSIGLSPAPSQQPRLCSLVATSTISDLFYSGTPPCVQHSSAGVLFLMLFSILFFSLIFLPVS